MQLASKDIAGTGAEIRHEVLLFVGITMGLTALTVAGALFWERKGRLLRA